MLCASYAYDYEKNHQDSSGHNFKKIWNDLEDDEKRVVIRYFYSLNNYEMLKEVNLIENPSEIQQIISDFIKNQYFDGFIELLKKQYPSLTKSDIHFYILFLMGYSDIEVGILTERDRSSVYRRRKRINVKMQHLCNMHAT